ncbi:MAG: LysR family transcriptional regulator [Alphaproteobacteria bacterium]|nr:LysR family transcriptional regulator [Alphaproteobacteria bacterium]
MDRLDSMRIFTRIVEQKSFSAAARDFGLPASTVTDAVKQLETRLGVRLLQRTTRHVSATVDGEAYYRRCLVILDDVEDAESAFGAKPRGLLHIDVQGRLARRFLLPALPQFLTRYPQIEFVMTEGDRFVDLVREGVDCVLRVGNLADSGMVARRLALLQEVTCASPGYIARFGMPRHWDALAGHQMVGFRSSAIGGVMPLEFQVGKILKTVMLPRILTVNGAESYRAAAIQGLGLIQIPRYSLDEDIARGALVPVLEDTPPSPSPLSLLYPQNRQISARLQVFMDWVMQELATHDLRRSP